MRLRLLLLILSVSSPPLMPPLVAQEVPCTRRTVLVTAVDRGGNPLGNLAPDRLRGSFRQQPVQIVAADLDTRPHRIVLLLDASGSMRATYDKWETTRMIAQDLARAAPPSGSVSLVIFGTKVVETVTAQEGVQAIVKRLVRLGQGKRSAALLKGMDKTAFFDAILEAIAQLNPPQLGDVICAITDGEDNASQHRPEEVRKRLLAAGIRFFAFLIGDTLPRSQTRTTVENDAVPHVERFTKSTGGNVIEIWPLEPLAEYPAAGAQSLPYFANAADRQAFLQAIQRMYQQMAVFYRVEVQLPLPVDKERNWQLEVVDERGKRSRDTYLIYPRRLLPCRDRP
jgi:Mg-chelatase subunit ChlD